MIPRSGFAFTEEADELLDTILELHEQCAAIGMSDEEIAAATRAFLDQATRRTLH